ncbi:hypothetical protein K457DRAFT_25039 [Linnemannia elongata AG-77]|uniref:Uncharacterized protein n=1 Tax=Linnemannia elongata AG-77 TaxID=1314771 RepID=A0A197JEQ0_9FUNG|nr:hypothetical protein K457DRAFT_25039 [Linnemannia elongata AG-77]
MISEEYQPSKLGKRSCYLISTMTAVNKIVLLLVAALAAPLAMTQAAGGPTIPTWCTCGEILWKTEKACSLAHGNWDGGSCGIVSSPMFFDFHGQCRGLGSNGRCWL